MNLLRTLTLTAVALALPAATLVPAQAAAPSERAHRSYVVKTTASTDAVVQGRRVVLSGTVRKARRGEHVRVQVRYDGGRWKTSDLSDRVDRRGRFRISDKITSTRSRSYRVVKPAGRGFRAGRSKAVHVDVYSWRPLPTLAPVNATATYPVDAVKINGRAYPESLAGSASDAQGGTSYNLERRCRQLTTRVGLADTSEDSVLGTASLKADGVQKYAGSFALTQSSPVTLDVSKVFRLTFDWTSRSTLSGAEDQTGAVVALGSPELLCRD
ncbi:MULTISPECIES: hypothetical protein [unclassified Nocardioides]|uniref:hypothetical protein n=1 Tax=unclassified Nocardioides TaxID=2615069 RepID=UPI00301457F1